jgi:poly(A) polymerase/tRNA nucleotidyltransferase (CCA-adding enzyme)
MNITLSIPFEVLYVLRRLKQTGFEAYLVGGSVRDLLLQALYQLQNQASDLHISDFDFTTNATPEQIQHLFPDSFYTNEFGTVGISYQNLLGSMVRQDFQLPKENIKIRLNQAAAQQTQDSIIDLARASKVHESLQAQVEKYDAVHLDQKQDPPPFEITTYRSEGVYSDFRRPDQVNWGDSIEQDLERRDFTINAMAVTLEQQVLATLFQEKNITQSLIKMTADQYKLVDLHQGLKDLTEQQIRTVRNPDERFTEDALRMLRAIRLACQLQFEIDPLTLASIKHHAYLIKKISWERIRQEFLKIMTTDQPDRGIRLMDEVNLLQHIMPELLQTKGVEQGGHHDTDVWTHTLGAVKYCPSKDPIVRLATLLHDIGKPQTQQVRNGEITFYNHEIVSSRIADKIAKRLRLSNEQRQRLFTLVRHHMFYYQPHHTDAAIRRLIKRVGLENIDDILALREGDRLGSGARKTSWRLEELKERIVKQLNQPMSVTDLAIDGNDLMEELNIEPSPILGKILNALLEKVLENPDLNTREKLLTEAKKIFSKL